MTKYTIQRNILLIQMLISSLVLGFIIYYVYPFIEENKGLAGTYYALTTILSFAIGIAVEYIMLTIFEKRKNKAQKEAIESSPTEEHESYKQQLARESQNRKINEFRNKFDTSI
ncbi:hypothetical protein [Enterobacter mori]